MELQVQRAFDEDPNRLVNKLKSFLDNPTRPAYHKTYWESLDELEKLKGDLVEQMKQRDEKILLARAAKKLMEKDASIKTERQALEMAQLEMDFEKQSSSTALVVKPLSRWEQFKQSVNFSPKRSRLYQKTLELKEKLEESDNPIIAKAMNAVGAAEDILGSAKKVVAPEVKKKGLVLLGEVIPNFNPLEFYVNIVIQLKPIINAFNEGDREFIFDMAAPDRYPYLEQKMKEMRKSKHRPGEEFESFILRYPKRPHILSVSIDDPAKPTVLLKFKLKKTAESALAPQEQGQEENKDASSSASRSTKAASSSAQVAAEDVKLVKANYVIALVFNTEVQEWQIFDFHEATMDVTM
jgi:hypothetical protein